MLSTILGLAFGGGADPQLLADPGPAVRWGLPIVKLFVNLGAAGTIGALVLTCFALSPKEREFNSALDFAAASAAFFTVASAATGFFTFLQVTNVPLSFDDHGTWIVISGYGSKVGSLVISKNFGTAINHLLLPVLPGPIIGLLLMLGFLIWRGARPSHRPLVQ